MAGLKSISIIAFSLMAYNAYAADFDIALIAAQSQCANISEKLSDLKKMAGINTAITGVGTAVATGATVVGIVKTSVDKDLHTILAHADKPGNTTVNPSANDALKVYDNAVKNINPEKSELYNKSKKLGAWRTGLLAGGTATNIAGAIIAAKNKIDDDLQTRIKDCVKSIDELKNAVGRARIDGVDTTAANNIITECGQWKYADIPVINTKAKGAMISSIVGATTGVVGTATSASANTDAARADTNKEKTLNTVSNVLAGGTALANGVATIFNATQIAATKKIIAIAEKCEGALQ